MSSNSFKLSGSMPPWPSICKSKKKSKPKPSAFPPDVITVICVLRWDDGLSGPQEWITSVTAIAGGTGAPNWVGTNTNSQGTVNIVFSTGDVGQAPSAQITAQHNAPVANLTYNGSAGNSTSLVPFVSGIVPIDGPTIEQPSTASAFG